MGGEVRKQTFRMPLDTENGKGIVYNSFHYPVIGELDDG